MKEFIVKLVWVGAVSVVSILAFMAFTGYKSGIEIVQVPFVVQSTSTPVKEVVHRKEVVTKVVTKYVSAPAPKEKWLGDFEYLRPIVKIVCTDGNRTSTGSGTVIVRGGDYRRLVLTNLHVLHIPGYHATACKAGASSDPRLPPAQWYELNLGPSKIDTDLDLAWLLVQDDYFPGTDSAIHGATEITDIHEPTFTIFRICKSNELNIGDRVLIYGYPAIGGKTITGTGGIISGFDGFKVKVDAKIEHGNSGGAAFLDKGRCWFGIPEVVTIGELESLGWVINYSALSEVGLVTD